METENLFAEVKPQWVEINQKSEEQLTALFQNDSLISFVILYWIITQKSKPFLCFLNTSTYMITLNPWEHT